MNTLDGVLITGGKANLFFLSQDNPQDPGVSYIKMSRFAQSVRHIIQIAKEFNRKRHFPVWGTCLGLEAILTAYSY